MFFVLRFLTPLYLIHSTYQPTVEWNKCFYSVLWFTENVSMWHALTRVMMVNGLHGSLRGLHVHLKTIPGGLGCHVKERKSFYLSLSEVLLTSFPCSFICLMDFSCSGWRGSPPQRDHCCSWEFYLRPPAIFIPLCWTNCWSDITSSRRTADEQSICGLFLVCT